MSADLPPHFAIACGGTGGHLFPGVAVGEAVLARGGTVTLFVSAKAIDQQAIREVRGMGVATLPAVGWMGRNPIRFLQALWASRRESLALFRQQRPAAVLTMGGFTGVGPILAGRSIGAFTCLHESNTIPGRANQWLARGVGACFFGFPEAGRRLRHRDSTETGTPVRERFRRLDASTCRARFELNPDCPVLGVLGGSQGASGLNRAVVQALPVLRIQHPTLQFIHLTGQRDAAYVEAAYRAAGIRAWVRPFCTEMERVLGAATALIARSGASTLAEIAAVGVPSVLVPFPAATDNHQFHNAAAFAASDAAVMLEQTQASPEALAAAVGPLLETGGPRDARVRAASSWHRPHAAEQIARRLLASVHRSSRPFVSLQDPEARHRPAPSA